MRPLMIMIATLATVVLFGSNVVLAEETDHSIMDHSNMDHSKMDMAEKTQASGKGVINSVDTEGRSINVTHEPMPDLGWPKMTMDLPVTRKVDLNNTNTGDAVSFTIKLGRDKKYRVIELSPLKE
jgi:Cu(I)/Ag(I) efflux system periplasmic protein CusF